MQELLSAWSKQLAPVVGRYCLYCTGWLFESAQKALRYSVNIRDLKQQLRRRQRQRQKTVGL